MTIDLGLKLRVIRRAKDLTLKQASGGAGVSLSYLSEVERGITVPSLPKLKKIATQYGLQASVILEDTEYD